MLANLRQFNLLDDCPAHFSEPLSVLIPARNEQAHIAATLRCLQSCDAIPWEALVLDDQSTDETAAIVRRIAQSDPRVRLLSGAPLEPDWNGKQFACWQLAQAAAFERLLFLDADVLLQPDAMPRLAAVLSQAPSSTTNQPDLMSVFPRQQTVTWSEQAIVPLIYYVLLGFLPIRRSRINNAPAYAAGCGQIFVTTASAYRRSGGHRSIANSRHDGLQLPRAFRRAGLRTDIADGSDLATVRMYHDFPSVCNGVMKNANEALARWPIILPATCFCLAPLALWSTMLVKLIAEQWSSMMIALPAVTLGHFAMFRLTKRFRLPHLLPLYFPLALVMFAALQALAFWKTMRGHTIAWRDRTDT